jgi:hexosaminidase
MKLFTNRIISSLLSVGILILLQACAEPTRLDEAAIIPKPVSISNTGKSFAFNSATGIVFEDEALANVSNYLAYELKTITGEIHGMENATEPADGKIFLSLAPDDELGQEGYELTITEKQIVIKGNQPAGIFYGVQTLLQLLPVSLNSGSKASVATGVIRDYPVYSWRGSMLDVARHFFSVEDVKRYIDLISAYKMNVLHLHLSDDQGWRIEIKSWPNLAPHGGATQVGGGKGGYYTQEQYADIVKYAASRYVTIVPEIDLPGHINSALAAYAELNAGTKVPEEGKFKGELSTKGIPFGKQQPTELYTGIEVGWSTLSYKNPASLRFVNDVIRELAAITPGPYLHVGGDEAHVTPKEEYIQFVNSFSEIVKANGKQLIGWEEIAQANIDNNAIAQHWDSEKHAAEAAHKGARIIMSPSKKVYLDMQYDSTSPLGLHWAAYIEVDDSYNWDPASRIPGIDSKQILGVEAPLWTETIVTMEDIEYMLFPRLPGVAEVGWTPAQSRSWDEYKNRLAKHGPRMKAKGINFYRSARVPWID